MNYINYVNDMTIPCLRFTSGHNRSTTQLPTTLTQTQTKGWDPKDD